MSPGREWPSHLTWLMMHKNKYTVYIIYSVLSVCLESKDTLLPILWKTLQKTARVQFLSNSQGASVCSNIYWESGCNLMHVVLWDFGPLSIFHRSGRQHQTRNIHDRKRKRGWKQGRKKWVVKSHINRMRPGEDEDTEWLKYTNQSGADLKQVYTIMRQ